MKLKVAKSVLLEGLQSVQNVVGTRSTLPILSNVLITAEKDSLSLTTTDLDVTVRRTLQAEVSKTGVSTLPVRRLSSIIRELTEADVELDVDEKDNGFVRCGASFFKIIGMSEEEFPRPPVPEGKVGYHVDQGVFREMLRKTAYAASTDETRYVLNGVLLSFRAGKLTMVATDGRRLALVEQEVEFPKEAETDVVLPTKAVNELVHVLGDEGTMKITPAASQVVMEFDSVMLASKLIDSQYPNYRQVIPSQCEERIAVERESLLTALRRVALLSADKTSAAELKFAKNQLTVSISTPDVGEARETIPLKYSGKELRMAFNPDYLMDPLKTLTHDEVYIELTDEMSPGVVRCESPFLYVIMPMRLT